MRPFKNRGFHFEAFNCCVIVDEFRFIRRELFWFHSNYAFIHRIHPNLGLFLRSTHYTNFFFSFSSSAELSHYFSSHIRILNSSGQMKEKNVWRVKRFLFFMCSLRLYNCIETIFAMLIQMGLNAFGLVWFRLAIGFLINVNLLYMYIVHVIRLVHTTYISKISVNSNKTTFELWVMMSIFLNRKTETILMKKIDNIINKTNAWTIAN